MIHAYNIYPSYIAKVIAGEAGLLSEVAPVYYLGSDELYEELDKLIEFQQMSLVASFDDCLIVYFENNLGEDQIKSLKIIYEVTPKLLPGALFCESMATIARERDARDYESRDPNMDVIANSLHTAIDILMKKRKTA